MRRSLVVVALLLAGCADDEGAATPSTAESTTTTAVRTPCGGWAVGDVHDDPPECGPVMLDQLAEQEGLALTPDAYEQAKSLCRRIDMSGAGGGLLTSLTDWEIGAAPSPADDEGTFAALAVAVYCPEHFDDLKALD